MNTNRVFTEEDKKSLPKVYIQQDTPEDNNNLHFKVKSVETDSEGVEHVNADLEHNYNGKKQKLNVSTTSDMIKMKNSDKSLDDQLSFLTDTVIEEVLLAANWVPGTNIPYTNRLNVSVPIEYDVQVVLNTNKKCIEYATDRMSWKELNDYAKKLLADGCKKLGIIKEDSELIKYYFHSIGHSLGLDVHDPSHANEGLKEGMVITIEPGLYIPEENIGIRIEDNILITKGKAILLSKDIIKEVKDLEEFLK